MKYSQFSLRHFSIGLAHGLAGGGALLLIIFVFAWMNADRFQAQRISDIPFEMLIVVPPPQTSQSMDMGKRDSSHAVNLSEEEGDIIESIHPVPDTEEHENISSDNIAATDPIEMPAPSTTSLKNEPPHHSDSHDIHKPHKAEEDKSLYIQDLVEESEYGPLPKISAMGKRPFDTYKHPFNNPEGQKIFSLIIAPVGISKDLTSNVIETLPRNVTLGFSPYTNTYQPLYSAAKKAGKEIWMVLPLEQRNPLVNDMGPLSLRADFSLEENKKNFKKTLGSAAAYTGLLALNADNTTLSFGSARNHDILREIEQRGLGLAYTSSIPINEIQASFVNDAVLHIQKLPDIPFEMLKTQIESIINTKESAVIVVHPYPSQIDDIAKWLHTLPSKGFVLAPLSAQITQLNTYKEKE